MNRRRPRFLFLILSLFLVSSVPSDIVAKGFSGYGGGRIGGARSFGRPGGSRSFSFSGSGARRNAFPRPSYDRAAGLARQREISAEKFSLWKRSRGYEEPRSFDPGLSYSRQERFDREIGIRQPNGYYREVPNVVIYPDNYDSGFLKYATLFWLFNHWSSVDHSRFDDQRVRDLEAKFRDLEAKGYKPDPDYTEPGVDPDLAYRKDVAYQPHGPGALARIFWAIVIAGLVAWLIWFIFIRRIPYAGAQEG
jgi:hypothetical protein